MQPFAPIPGESSMTRSCRHEPIGTKRLSRGSVLRIVDLEGCQAVDTLIYDARDTGSAITPLTP